jgi:hypothetical protein
MGRDAFISHSTKDGARLANELCAALEQRGLHCWIAPRDVTWVTDYGQAIRVAVEDCHVFVLVITSGANESKEIVREAQLASRFEKPVIPVSVDGVEPGTNVEYYVAGWQYFRCPASPDEADLDRLADAIRGASTSVPSGNEKPPAPLPWWRKRSANKRFTRYFAAGVSGAVGLIGVLALVVYLTLGNAALRPPVSHTAKPDDSKTARQGKKEEAPRPNSAGAAVPPPPRVTPPKSRSTAVASPSSLARDPMRLETPAGNAVSEPADNADSLIVEAAQLHFVSLPGGSVLLSCDAGDTTCAESNGGARTVTVAPFQISTTEVTQEVWRKVMDANPSDFPGDDLPVHNVSWNDAQAFVGRLNRRADGYRYRLPTEAEWEFASRGVGATPDLKVTAWLGLAAVPSRNGVQPVATKRANAWKLFDMFGNIAEWCEDSRESDRQRVARGGSWMDTEASLAKSNRSSYVPSTKTNAIGVRLVRSPSK